MDNHINVKKKSRWALTSYCFSLAAFLWPGWRWTLPPGQKLFSFRITADLLLKFHTDFQPMLLLFVSQQPWHEFCSNLPRVKFIWQKALACPTSQSHTANVMDSCLWSLQITLCTFATFSSAVPTEGHNFVHFTVYIYYSVMHFMKVRCSVLNYTSW
jgi:hypothetical protein